MLYLSGFICYFVLLRLKQVQLLSIRMSQRSKEFSLFYLNKHSLHDCLFFVNTHGVVSNCELNHLAHLPHTVVAGMGV